MAIRHAIEIIGWHRQTRNKHVSNVAVRFTFFACDGSFTDLHNNAFAYAKQLYPNMSLAWNGYIQR